jgi:Protein of unknown function (DUF998)
MLADMSNSWKKTTLIAPVWRIDRRCRAKSISKTVARSVYYIDLRYRRMSDHVEFRRRGRMNRAARMAGHAALLFFLLCALTFGAMAGAQARGFSHWTHPLSWLGADGISGAGQFNLFVFVFPGLLAAVALWPLRSVLPEDARWTARIGAQLVMLSALAFAAQGLLPLDLEDPDGIASGLHALAWTAWCLAFCSGALLLAWGLRTAQRYPRIVVPRIVVTCALAGIAVPLLAFAASPLLPNALAQRGAFLLWFVWVAWIGRVPLLSRA